MISLSRASGAAGPNFKETRMDSTTFDFSVALDGLRRGVEAETEFLRASRASAVRCMLAAEDRELAALGEVDELRAEVEKLQAQRAAVLALHEADSMGLCGHCGFAAPCPTVQAGVGA